jgi:hypothetical protein
MQVGIFTGMKKLFAAALLVLLAGCSAPVPTSAPPEPLKVSGELIWRLSGHNNPCFSAPIIAGITDLAPGATVTIRNAGGETVALGQLGEYTHDRNGQCTFKWAVEGVPADSEFYSVEVSNRGEVNVTREELQEGVTLRVG